MTDKTTALFADFYEFTMAQGYWKTGINRKSVFEMFFRKNPFLGGFSIFAGLQTLIDALKTFSFSHDDLEYLRSLDFFEEAFIDFLKDFHFSGDVYAQEEGSVVFPQEPILRVEGGLIECQLIEGLVLNTINFQSLVATKTARVFLASGKGQIMEFGLRRAQGPDGALSASRAAVIGGAAGVSNVEAGKRFGVKLMGTMAHSWVMAFPGEEEAFRAYAALYPRHPVFLIDTYDTLKSGIVNAIKVGKELAKNGGSFGVRLDSGDVQYLSCEVRKRLDAEGFKNATIAVSNDLDEEIISALVDENAPVNSWGVGTKMVTGRPDAAFTGVYKLAAFEDANGMMLPSIKFSDNPEKTTIPGIKQVWRIYDKNGMAQADVNTMEEMQGGEKIESGKHYTFYHTSADYRHFHHFVEKEPVPLLKKCVEGGAQISKEKPVSALRERCLSELDSLDPSYKRILNPHIYKVSISEKLRTLKLNLIKKYLGD
ncbi:MAG: nicotinate phosphoribosyltransferase [Spirochaetaceae bacterium]|jgi:nicotinate phosphoribosyltransferase|nr:nicotinate phosphoribosyltransferase [Spirochaetaceae bacterium]